MNTNQTPAGGTAAGLSVVVGSAASCEHQFSYDDHADLWRCPCGATALEHPDESLHRDAMAEADHADQFENSHW
jgi:hypothetical protein